MRKWILAMLCVVASAAVAGAVSPRVGAYLGYTMIGDVEERSIAYGAQAGLDFNQYFGVVLSVGRSGDEASEGVSAGEFAAIAGYSDGSTANASVEFDATEVAVSAVVAIPLGDVLRVYGGGGGGYYIMSGEASGSIDPGPTTAAFLASIGASQASASADLDMDNAIGFHALAGVAFGLTKNIELFGEFRYTMLRDVSGSVDSVSVNMGGALGSIEIPGAAIDAALGAPAEMEDDYNFGMVRAGACMRW